MRAKWVRVCICVRARAHARRVRARTSGCACGTQHMRESTASNAHCGARAFASMHAMHACTRARMHARTHARTHACTRTRTRTHACTHTRTHAHTHTRTYASRPGALVRPPLAAQLPPHASRSLLTFISFAPHSRGVCKPAASSSSKQQAASNNRDHWDGAPPQCGQLPVHQRARLHRQGACVHAACCCMGWKEG